MSLNVHFVYICLLLLLGKHSLGLPHSSQLAADGSRVVVSLSSSPGWMSPSIHYSSSALPTAQASALASETATEPSPSTYAGSYKSSIPAKSQTLWHPGFSVAGSSPVSQHTSGHTGFPTTSSQRLIRTIPVTSLHAESSGQPSRSTGLTTSGTPVPHISESQNGSGARASPSRGSLQPLPSRTSSFSQVSDMSAPSTTSMSSRMLPPSLSSSTPPLTAFASPPPAFYASSVSQHLSASNTLITTKEHGHPTVLPVFGGFALHGIKHTGTYYNLPGISGGVHIPCLVSCSSGDFPSAVSQSSSGSPEDDNDGDNGDDNDDDNQSTSSSRTTTTKSCTSASTSTISSEFVQCITTSTNIAGPQTVATTCSTSTITSVATGCDIRATAGTSTTMASTSNPDLPPLTIVSFVVGPPSSSPTSSPPLTTESFVVGRPSSIARSPTTMSSASVSSTSGSSTSGPLLPPLTMERFVVTPPAATSISTQSSSSSSTTPISLLSPTVSATSSIRVSRSMTKAPTTTFSTARAHSPTFTQTTIPPVSCHQNWNPKLASPRCECTRSGSIYFHASLASNSVDPCGYTTMPSSTIAPTITPPPIVTNYIYTDVIDSIVKSCATASVVPKPWAPVRITTCDEPTPISTLHPQTGTATLHVWEAWPTDEVTPKVHIAAIMNDTDQVTVARQKPVEVNLGENVTIPISNLEQYPMNIEPVSGINLDKRVGPPMRPFPVDHSSLVFYVNGFTFNSKDDSEENKGQVLPYCSVGDWDYGSAEDQFADFLGVFLPMMASENMPNRQLDCYVMF